MDKRAKNQIVDSDIARLLLKLRKSRNLTVTELAQRSGVSQAMISPKLNEALQAQCNNT